MSILEQNDVWVDVASKERGRQPQGSIGNDGWASRLSGFSSAVSSDCFSDADCPGLSFLFL